MDAFVTITKASTGPKRSSKPKQTHFAPYASGSAEPGLGGSAVGSSSHKRVLPSDTSLKKAVVKNLRDEENPITNSSAPERGYHLVSNTSGHQMSNGVRTYEHDVGWAKLRSAKLKHQGAKAETGIFKGVLVYINGGTGSETVNLEIIRLIQSNGGHVTYAMSKSQCTHVLVSHNLNGKKTQDEFNLRKSKIKFVKPAWVLDSVEAGKRLSEIRYAVLFQEAQPAITKSMNLGLLQPTAESSEPKRRAHSVDDDLAWLQASKERSASKSPAPEPHGPPPSAQAPRASQRP